MSKFVTLSCCLLAAAAMHSAAPAMAAGNTSPLSMGAASAPIGLPPGAPTDLTAMAGNAKVTLTWDITVGAIGYRIRRSTVSGGPYGTIASISVQNLVTATWTNSGLTNGTTYYYVVAGMGINGDGPNSAQASATPASPPGAPTGLTATPGSARITLAWNASAGATAYRVRRSLTSGGPYRTVATVTNTDWINTSLVPAVAVYYVVAATNVNGDGPNSTQASATPGL
jgi:cellulose 1,4-beta-cellobiosidase